MVGEHRLILVRLYFNESVMAVIHNRQLLSSRISISTVKPSSQRSHLATLREMVEKHNAIHPDTRKTIKYLNDAPTIVEEDLEVGRNSSSRTTTAKNEHKKNSKPRKNWTTSHRATSGIFLARIFALLTVNWPTESTWNLAWKPHPQYGTWSRWLQLCFYIWQMRIAESVV